VSEAGIAGPFFISIGDADKLNAFLSNNPDVPAGNVFVDGYDFEAYKSMGLKNMGDDKSVDMKDIKMEAPEMGGFGGWMKYFSIVGKVSPVPDGMKFGEIPEGVMRLGATFVVDRNEIIYQYNDKVPGDHPVPAEVLEVVKTEVKTKKSKLFSLF